MGSRARRRIAAGGVRARGRPAASVAEWAAIRLRVLRRAQWTCQACGVWGRRLDVHHVVKRAQGGSDFDLDRLVALCRPCHAQTDAPFDRGRLLIEPLGGGTFRVAMVQRANKWTVG
jgi:5-methylcytosine-specific restriction endonuclease McrA